MKSIPSLYIRTFLLFVVCSVSLALAFSHVSLAAEGEQGSAPTASPTILAPDDPRNVLHLSSDQQERMAVRHQKYQEDAAAVLASSTLTQPEKDKQLDALFDAAEKDLRAMLTPDQAVELNRDDALEVKNQQIRREMLQQKFVLSTELQKTITPAQLTQMEKVEAIGEELKAQIYADNSLTTSQKGVRLVDLERAYNSQMADILNTPQQRQLEAQIAAVQKQEQAAEKQAVTQL